MSVSGGRGEGHRLRVMIVDDSAVVREGMTTLLKQEADIDVVTAADPLIAETKMARARPDVIILDLNMPRMDGITFLKQLMSTDPIPVVVCSGHVGSGSELAIRALEEGAVELVARPILGVRQFLEESAQRLIDAVRAAAEAHVVRRAAAARPREIGPDASRGRHQLEAWQQASRSAGAGGQPSRAVIVVGASTGGTEALRVFLEAIPPDGPGIVIVQHMPAPFVAPFAFRLDQTSRIKVSQAEDGDLVLDGRALIAPGDRHISLKRNGFNFAVELADGPPVSRHRPSVDVLFESAARTAGPHAVGVLMTGMGADGAEGLLHLHRAGARTIAQDEATSIVFGMPKAAIGLGAADEVLPLERIAEQVLRWVRP